MARIKTLILYQKISANVRVRSLESAPTEMTFPAKQARDSDAGKKKCDIHPCQN